MGCFSAGLVRALTVDRDGAFSEDTRSRRAVTPGGAAPRGDSESGHPTCPHAATQPPCLSLPAAGWGHSIPPGSHQPTGLHASIFNFSLISLPPEESPALHFSFQGKA